MKRAEGGSTRGDRKAAPFYFSPLKLSPFYFFTDSYKLLIK